MVDVRIETSDLTSPLIVLIGWPRLDTFLLINEEGSHLVDPFSLSSFSSTQVLPSTNTSLGRFIMASEQPKVIEPVEMDEKVSTPESAHLEHSLRAGLSHEEAHFLHDFPEKEHDKIYRKVDFRLMPMLMALYLIANLDRYVAERLGAVDQY